jgi:hypothetical protein
MTGLDTGWPTHLEGRARGGVASLFAPVDLNAYAPPPPCVSLCPVLTARVSIHAASAGESIARS